MEENKAVAWWSAGITSAVACKLALEKYKEVDIVFIETGNHHADNVRFKHECEKWYGQKIKTIRSNKYENVQDVIIASSYINSPYGAPCTVKLKKDVRAKYVRDNEPKIHILGYDFSLHEKGRAERFKARNPTMEVDFMLLENELSKDECAGILLANHIELPIMYKLGYEHNNCIGCVKGGKGYWNKIREDFPEVFKEFSELEREVGASCINGIYLDELATNAGRSGKVVMPSCGIFCSHKFI